MRECVCWFVEIVYVQSKHSYLHYLPKFRSTTHILTFLSPSPVPSWSLLLIQSSTYSFIHSFIHLFWDFSKRHCYSFKPNFRKKKQSTTDIGTSLEPQEILLCLRSTSNHLNLLYRKRMIAHHKMALKLQRKLTVIMNKSKDALREFSSLP